MLTCKNKNNVEQLLISYYDEVNNCPVDWTKELIKIAKENSCGKCTFCRDGTAQVYKIIQDITNGDGREGDFNLLLDILEGIKVAADCENAIEAAKHCIEMLNKFPEEWENHILRKRCSNLVCKSYYTLHISPTDCIGCEKCLEVCNKNAIIGRRGYIHLIDNEKCNKCLDCIGACPVSAIIKAGSVKPKIPTELIEVGSFNINNNRRRRRGK